jgi:hypothetical protein
MLALRAQEQQAKPGAAVAPAASTAAPAAPGEEKVAFTFTDNAQVQQFAQLWQQRQAVLAKMAVLQSYWREEQANLGTVNQELLTRYNIDVNKNYTFDPNRKVLIEKEAQPQPPAELGQVPAAQAPPVPHDESQPDASAPPAAQQ